MRRGEIWWVSFDPSLGGEIKKTRPAVIVSNDAANKALNRVQVVPLSSQVEKLYPCETYIRIKDQRGKAMADQIATIAKERIKTYISKVTQEEIKAIERVIRLQLGL